MTSRGEIVNGGVWVGPADRPLAAWLTQRAEETPVSGVLILPPVGYEYWTAQRTLRVLADRLAANGHAVIRIDYEGTGDSSGDQSDPDRWERWSSAVPAGVRALRAAGARKTTLVGLRLGASIALAQAAGEHVDAVAAIAPIVSGRRYARELALLSTRVPEAAEDSVEAGTITFAGTVFAPDTVKAIARLELGSLGAPPAPRVLLLDREDGAASSKSLAFRLQELGCQVEHDQVGGLEVALDLPTEEADAGLEMVDRVADWIGEAELALAGTSQGWNRRSAEIIWRGETLREEFVSLGESRLAGVLTSGAAKPRATVVFLNSGSEAHVGPGRAWVELARALALHGIQALRVDFRGWGESPDDGFAPGRPYDRHSLDDVAEMTATLRRNDQPPVFFAGVCAGAWIALKQATSTEVDGVIAINPQLYWQPGDPVEALMSTTRKRRMPEIERFKRDGAELERTEPHPVGDWLRALQEAPIPTLILSSEDDDGLEFLQTRVPKAWAAALASNVIRLQTVGIDHSLHQFWQRDELTAQIVDFVNDL